MSTLYLDRRDLQLTLAPGRLRIHAPAQAVSDVPLALLERLVILSNVVLDTSVLGALAEAGVAVLILSPRRHERLAILLGRAHNDLAVRLSQAEHLRNEAWCLAWTRRLVQAKLRAQHRLACTALLQRPDARLALFQAAANLQGILSKVGQATSIASLRGLEGAAAVAHFQALAALMPPELGFGGRNRRPPRDPINAVLSLGYTLLHFEAVRAAHAAGLDPYLGFYHRPSFARASLACDLIEPLRPWLDEHIWRLFAQRQLRADHFSYDRNACLLDKAGRAHFYSAYEMLIRPARRALRRSTRQLAKALAGELEMPIAEDVDEEAALS